mmetsp:Transcript_25516/g.82215  ORF Transcript_25516/g.82215 Transcript_25516/m.82215 type:complete len:181 (+) Transcript_25516:874-1416(+)
MPISLPLDLQWQVLSFLDARSLCACSSVCTELALLPNDNSLWRALCAAAFPPHMLDKGTRNWKAEFAWCTGTRKRNKEYMRRWSQGLTGRHTVSKPQFPEGYELRRTYNSAILPTASAGSVSVGVIGAGALSAAAPAVASFLTAAASGYPRLGAEVVEPSPGVGMNIRQGSATWSALAVM